MCSDFVQHGDLYISKSFANEGWEEREPQVDIAVFNGTVDLRLKQKIVQQRRSSINYISLEDIIFDNIKYR